MKQITNKEYNELKQLKRDIAYGRILTTDGLRFICESNGYNAKKIGEHMLEVIAKIAEA